MAMIEVPLQSSTVLLLCSLFVAQLYEALSLVCSYGYTYCMSVGSQISEAPGGNSDAAVEVECVASRYMQES